ncbi:MAG: cardiolipin synthase ClsB [Pseudomonadota bacterium]|nr:MAG: cardiolipin synthase ClsB [Pseudomonadota bacterium]
MTTGRTGRVEAYATLRVGEHRLSLLRDGEQAYPSMLEAIASARSHICLETYIFRADRTGRRFARALAERARAGVEVNVIVDAWGSPLPGGFVRRLQRAGVRILHYNPVRLSWRALRTRFARFFRRNHRKVLVVDNRVGFTGGLNIADDYASERDGGQGWRDTHLRIEGPAVAELLYIFRRTWEKEGGPPLDESRYRNEARRPDPKVRVLASDIRRGRRMIKDAFLQAMRQARERIWITSAYFLPTRKMLKALCGAAQRGVDVRVIVAGTTDVIPARYAAQSYYPRLLKSGVRVYEWVGTVLHAKTALVDRDWATVGSSNLDALSLRKNLEVNAFVEDRAFNEVLARLFEEDLENCVEIEWRWFRYRPLLDRLLSFVLGRLQRWI